MGLSQARFREALKQGKHEEVRTLFLKKTVQDSLEPNASLGPPYGENSVLHYAAQHAMAWLYGHLLDRGGKPDMRNGEAKNSLHLVCGSGERAKQRETILRTILELGLEGMDVKHVLRERDVEGDTALHLAAGSGLEGCVHLLLEHGADIFATNKREQTAADCAALNKHSSIATLLETKMVFSAEDEANPAPSPEADHTHLMELAEAPSGMKDGDLRCLKDQLLIETSELLGVPLFTSEALLRDHGWSKEKLLNAWMEGPQEACDKAGVQLPSELGADHLDGDAGVCVRGGGGEEEEEERECGVCTELNGADIEVPCGHFFCRDCWQQYLHTKIQSGEIHTIVCPAYGCYKLVPMMVVEAVVSKEMAQRYLQFDIRAFVESNPNMRWCPHANCHRAVHRLDGPEHSPEPTTVHCGNEHYFCWRCSGEPHEPCSCQLWRQWLGHIQDMAVQVGDRTAGQLDNAASERWLATRSKPCPKCKVPIERTEGCNHMCCKKCKHDFCWVCLDEWKLHNTSTGGYFECNRYQVRKKAEVMLAKRKAEVMEGVQEAERLRKFLHYYERYKTHKESLQLELPFLRKAHHKMAALRRSIVDTDRRATISGPLDLTFIEEAVRELLAARRVLIASYGFGYYLKGRNLVYRFENDQGTLEQVTELLAQVVARPHLRKPRSDIIRLTRDCREKRAWLLKDCQSLSEDTPSPGQFRDHGCWREPVLDSDSSSDSLHVHIPGAGEHSELLGLGRSLQLPSTFSSSQPESQDELQQALELSRQEFEEQKRLLADIELAKQLSLREPSPQAAESCQPHLQEDLVFLKSASSLLGSRGKAEPRLFRPPTLQPIGLQLAAPLPLPPTSYSPSPPPSLSPSLPPAANHGSSVDVDVDASNGTGMGLDLGLPHSPVTNGDPASGSEWDEEELATALSLSLMDVPALSPA